ncbi:MAG: C25 family cysteine peptidase [Bacteroidota bacterium]
MSRCLSILLGIGWLLTGSLPLPGQELPLKLNTPVKERIISLEFSEKQFLFEASVDMLHIAEAGADGGFVALAIPGFYPFGTQGAPSLPRTTLLFEAGPHEETLLSIEEMDSMLFDLPALGVDNPLLPFRPSVQKGALIKAVRADSAIYATDGWIGGPVVSVEYEGKMRGLSISNLHFNPVQYNPVKRQLKVYYNIRGTIKTAPLSRTTTPSEAFSKLFGRVVRQEAPSQLKAAQSEEPMTLVILSDTMFREAMAPLVQWKSRKGFRVVEAYTTDNLVGGSRESIKAYLKGLYQQPAPGIAPPSYLLIVGDDDRIPLSQEYGEVTDLYYATYDGEGDYIPELFYGRISVRSPQQLQSVVDKILEYEQYQFPDPSFLDKAVLIAGVDGTYASSYGNGQINYANDHYINEAEGIQTHMFRYPESGSSRQAILDLISDGVGFVNYTGHGEWDRWMDPAFLSSDIDQLQNLGKYPVMIGNGCETNYFAATECFAEALIRAQGKGALAYIGCTNDSYWDEDYFWAVGVGPIREHPEYEETTTGYFDRVFHAHGEDYDLWTPTLGEMVFGGNMAVQQSSSSRKKFYWEIYQLAGDPTLVPWFSQPGVQEVELPGVVATGTKRVDLRCAPYSYISLTYNGVLLDAMHSTSQGFATLQIPDTLTGGSLDLVVSGEGFRPFMEEILLGTPSGPYLDLLGYNLSLESVKEDLLISPGEEAALDLVLVNRGGEAILNDTLLLFSTHNAIEVEEALFLIEQLNPGDTLELSGVFRFVSANLLIDQEIAVMGIRLTDASPLYIRERLHAPVLVSGGISWDDRPKGNGNGIVEPGEWLSCRWQLVNRGHFSSGPLEGTFPDPNRSLIGEVLFNNSPVVELQDSATLQFDIKVASPGKGWYGSGLLQAEELYSMVTDSFRLSVDRYAEDFKEGRLHFPFKNSAEYPWRVDETTWHSPGYSMKSGGISHSQQSETSLCFDISQGDSLSFFYRVSSEPAYDFLNFYVDSLLDERWSGERGWSRYAVYLEAGAHTITWSYRKDYNVSKGEDAAWIDEITFPGGAFVRGDLSLMEITQPDPGPWLTAQEQVTIRVRNTSSDPIDGFSARFLLNGVPFAEGDYEDSLLPGEEAQLTGDQQLDLSGFSSWLLGAELISDSLGYSGNNRLEKLITRTIYPDLALSLIRVDNYPGTRVDATIRVENRGNIRIDSLHYEILLDGGISGSGVRYIGVEADQVSELTLILTDSLQQLSEGTTYLFLIRSVIADSVSQNNQAEGHFTWQPLNVPSTGQRSGWHIYPNPASAGFRIILDEPVGCDERFELVTLTGMVVNSFAVAEGTESLEIPTGPTAPGTYLLRRINSGEALLLVILP